MSIKTATAYRVTPGMTILKHISDGHYYGEVASIERINGTEWVVTFTDGDTKTLRAGETVYIKDNA